MALSKRLVRCFSYEDFSLACDVSCFFFFPLQTPLCLTFLLIGFLLVVYGNWTVITYLHTYYFYQVDALTTKRGQEGGWVVERLLNQAREQCFAIFVHSKYLSKMHDFFFQLQLLIELDGSEQRKGVYVIGATNRY